MKTLILWLSFVFSLLAQAECTVIDAQKATLQFLRESVADQSGNVRVKNIEMGGFELRTNDNLIMIYYSAKIASKGERYKKHVGMIPVSASTCQVRPLAGWASAIPALSESQVETKYATEHRAIDTKALAATLLKNAKRLTALNADGTPSKFDIVDYLKQNPEFAVSLFCSPITEARAKRIKQMSINTPQLLYSYYKGIEFGDAECDLRIDDGSVITIILNKNDKLKSKTIYIVEVVG